MLPSTRVCRPEIESGFDSFDGTRLFYRAWLPETRAAKKPVRVLVFLHRGHEHSARIRPLLDPLLGEDDYAFAWDARGHGFSPGQRGDAPDFYTLVRDFDEFVQHLIQKFGFAIENVMVIANSVGAVIAASWVHDFAPRIRGLVMAAAAFEINLYVPLAKPALRLALRFNPDLAVTSYIRSSMLTHSLAEAAAYDADHLITKNISARVLLDLADTAARIVADAAAIDVPVLMLVAGRDFVVKEKPQQLFFERLSSSLKRLVKIERCHHAIFYEADTWLAFQETRQFIDAAFAQPVVSPAAYHGYDRESASALGYRRLQEGSEPGWISRLVYGLQRQMLHTLGCLSDGMRIGLEKGFDAGASLDYVYRNRVGGRLGIGKIIDGGYLAAIGWRGIRLRKVHLQKMLGDLIERHPAGQPLRILDVAAGGGRYVLETVKCYQERLLDITLRDYDGDNLRQAQQLAEALGLNASITYQQRDAFDPASYVDDEAPYDIVIVSGLYELFPENAPVLLSLMGIARQLRAGGYLVYTGQPWHPQLAMISCTLNDHQGKRWTMRPRPQVELDALVASAGCQKIATEIGLAGIFTVSLAQKVAAHGAGD